MTYRKGKLIGGISHCRDIRGAKLVFIPAILPTVDGRLLLDAGPLIDIRCWLSGTLKLALGQHVIRSKLNNVRIFHC